MFVAVAGWLVPVLSAYALGIAILPGKQATRTGAFAVAAALYATLIFLAAWAGLFSVGLVYGAAAVCVAAAVWRKPLWRGAWPEMPAWAWAVFGVLTAVYVVMALAPETRSDAITYHLGFIPETLRTGALPGEVSFYEVLPKGMESLFLAGAAIGGYSSAKLIHLTFLLLSVPLICSLAPKHGYMAALLYIATPVVAESGTSAYTDAAFVFFLLAAVALEGGLWSGVAAGFAYATKLSGGFVAPVVIGYHAWKREWKKALLAACGAAVVALPHMARAFAMSDNPVAPLFNGVFPNAHFTAELEARYRAYLTSYGTTGWADALRDLFFSGDKVQGMLGPALLVLPLALLVYRSKYTWLGVALSGLWMLNHGARFAMPALPFLLISLMLVLPQRALYVLLAIHVCFSFPRSIPVRAALRLEPEEQYLHRLSFDYRVAEMLKRHAKPGARVLDLYGAPRAYAEQELTGSYHSIEGAQATKALSIALRTDAGVLQSYEASWNPQPLTAIRIEAAEATARPWMLNEVEFTPGQKRLTVEAEPQEWHAARAADRNLTTGWSTGAPTAEGDYWQADFPAPFATAGVKAICYEAERPSALNVYGKRPDGKWTKLATARARSYPAINLRPYAASVLRDLKFDYVLTLANPKGYGLLGLSFNDNASDWGLEKLDNHEEVHLYRVRKN